MGQIDRNSKNIMAHNAARFAYVDTNINTRHTEYP